MKRKVMGGVLVVFLFFALPVYAQESPQSVDDVVSKMQSQLNLTQDEVNAIKPIIQENMAKRQELRQSMKDGAADRDSIRTQMQQLRDQENQKLSEVLTADQMSQWQNMQNHMRQGRRHQ